eukprot:5366591-Prymnesium_polylepis.1
MAAAVASAEERGDDDDDDEKLDSDRSERTKTAEEAVAKALQAAVEVPVAVASVRANHQVMEETQLAEDI